MLAACQSKGSETSLASGTPAVVECLTSEQVDAGGHTCATGVGAAPHGACLDSVYQCLCFPSSDMLRDGNNCINGITCSPTFIVGMYPSGEHFGYLVLGIRQNAIYCRIPRLHQGRRVQSAIPPYVALSYLGSVIHLVSIYPLPLVMRHRYREKPG